MTVPELEVFHSIGKALTSTLNLSEVLAIIMEKTSALFNPSHWSLLLLDEDKQELRYEIVVGKGTEALQGKRRPIDRGIAGWVAREGKPAVIADAAADKRFDPAFDRESGVTTRDVVAVPLISKNRLLGVIELLNVLGTREFGDLQLELLNTLADYAAIAIDNARAVARIRELTVTDDVTGLYNARFLESALEQTYRRALRYNSPCSVVFMDLDYFKHVNDNYGHLVGSDVLRETAVILRENLRVTDIATRYGGDEFVVILPDTSQADALVVTQRCHAAIKGHVFGLAHGERCNITASFGIATMPDDTTDKLDLLRLADQAMYYVKEHSRDNIAVASVLRR